MTALYNEIEPFAVGWTRELIKRGHIAPGRVEPKSITEIHPEELYGTTQFHAFAGIGVWSYALRLAGWPDDREVWTGSCPCQPFSVAGVGGGTSDERHLWPDWFKLIDKCRPAVVLGEQVASPAGLAWLDTVRADLEGAGYAFGASDLCAAGVGAPHIRQRLYFTGIRLADTDTTGRSVERSSRVSQDGDAPQRHDVDGRGEAIGLGHADGGTTGRDGRASAGAKAQSLGERLVVGHLGDGAGSSGCWMGEPIQQGLEGHGGHGNGGNQPGRLGEDPNGSTPTAGLWSNPEWVYCRDGKYRPVEPGVTPLVDGTPARVGRLRGYGNSIVAPLAAEFIKAVMEAICP